IRAGGGFVGVHSATDTFYRWPEYGKLVGGSFDGHSWPPAVTAAAAQCAEPFVAFLCPSLGVSHGTYQIPDFDAGGPPRPPRLARSVSRAPPCPVFLGVGRRPGRAPPARAGGPPPRAARGRGWGAVRAPSTGSPPPPCGRGGGALGRQPRCAPPPLVGRGWGW